MYNQPQKKRARTLALDHAVELLTTRRENAAVVDRGYVAKVRNTLSERDGSDATAASECTDQTVSDWEAFWISKVGIKVPGDLVVAYLAGPEPMNDFNELVRLGVHPHNIYAFESENKVFNTALESAKKSDFPLIKIIKMPIDRYFQAVPMVFDIIYFDACGPFPSTSQGTLRTIANVFRYQRLSSLGVLITNFATPDLAAPTQLDAHSDLVAAYLYPKAMLESGDLDWNLREGAAAYGKVPKEIGSEDSFFDEVQANFPIYYGQYITRQLFDLASVIVPLSRLAGTNLWSYFFNKTPAEMAAESQLQITFDEDGGGGEYVVDADMNALGWSLASLSKFADENYLKPEATSSKLTDSWRRELSGSPTVDIDTIVNAYLYMRNDRSAKFLKPSMNELLVGYNYVQNMYMFCDFPTQELALFPIVAQFAMPYHYNVDETRRYQYVADGKSTEMFMDVIPFDTCRYIYDWLPSTELVSTSFSMKSHQLAYRFALDGLLKHTIRYNNEYVFGGHVIGVNEDGFTERLLQPREKIA